MLKWISDHPVPAISLGFGGVVIFVVAPLMWFDHHGGGEYFGALVGFLALLAGALFNAHLERQRDRRLHQRDVLAAVLAVLSELSQNIGVLTEIIEGLGRGDVIGTDKHSVAQQFSMLSDRVFDRDVETFMGASLLATLTHDSRIFDAYRLNIVLARDFTARVVAASPFPFINGIELTRLRDLTARTLESTIAAYKAIDGIRSAIAGTEFSRATPIDEEVQRSEAIDRPEAE